MTRPPATGAAGILIATAVFFAAGGHAAGAGGRERGADFWAIGYAVSVARSCPGWMVERQEILAERGMLPRSDPASGMLRMDPSADREYLCGQTAAMAAARRHVRFCRNVRTVAGPRWARLSRVLRFRRDGTP